MRAIKFFFTLFTTVILATSCCTVSGSSSRQMKKAVLNSYLFKASDKFYPSVEEITSADKFPKLNRKQVREIGKELRSLLTAVQKLHRQKYDYINKMFGGNALNDAEAKIAVTSRNVPICRVNPDNTIEIDVKIAQALFRGALLDYVDNSDPFFRDRFVNVSDIKKNDSDREQKIIKKFIEKKEAIRRTAAHTCLGDMFSMVSADEFDDSSWFRLSNVTLSSMELMNWYAGASLFIIAHEYGHIVLKHKERLLEEESGSFDCQTRVNLELEADAYAVVLLTELGGPIPLDIAGLDKLTGYDNFFRYVYQLGGFPEEESHSRECSYPGLDQRLMRAGAVEAAVRKKKEDALWTEIFKQITTQVEKKD